MPGNSEKKIDYFRNFRKSLEVPFISMKKIANFIVAVFLKKINVFLILFFLHKSHQIHCLVEKFCFVKVHPLSL